MTSETFQPDVRLPLREVPASAQWTLALTGFALPVLIIIVYTNASDLAIRAFSIPSILQPLIVLLALLVWILRAALKPSEVLFQPLTILLGAYCFVLFVSSLWARDVALADQRFSEALKSLAIYFLVGSLAF